MNKKIRIGSRESKLAVIQSQIVIDLINKNFPEYETELVTMKTTGDKILDKTLDKVGGKGLFVKELDRALLEKRVDITVHSLKDVPMIIDEKIPLKAFIKREYPYDVLVLPKGKKEIDFSKPVGSSSQRRCIQFKGLHKDAEIKAVRGNVITRLEKLDRGEYSALILAQAGLKRLGLENRINYIFTADEIIPAAGQGIIALQARKEDNFDFLSFINDKNAEISAMCERAFVRELDGGCSSPIAGFSETDGEKIRLRGFFADENHIIIKNAEGDVKDCEKIGINLAARIKEALKNG